MEVNGQFESVCESVFSELESQAVEALDLPMPGCFRMRSHSYVRAIEKGCSQDDECVSLRSSSPPRTTTTVRTIQSSTGECAEPAPRTPPRRAAPQLPPDAARGPARVSHGLQSPNPTHFPRGIPASSHSQAPPSSSICVSGITRGNCYSGQHRGEMFPRRPNSILGPVLSSHPTPALHQQTFPFRAMTLSTNQTP